MLVYAIGKNIAREVPNNRDVLEGDQRICYVDSEDSRFVGHIRSHCKWDGYEGAIWGLYLRLYLKIVWYRVLKNE